MRPRYAPAFGAEGGMRPAGRAPSAAARPARHCRGGATALVRGHAIPATIKRQVWELDRGCCSYVDGAPVHIAASLSQPSPAASEVTVGGRHAAPTETAPCNATSSPPPELPWSIQVVEHPLRRRVPGTMQATAGWASANWLAAGASPP